MANMKILSAAPLDNVAPEGAVNVVGNSWICFFLDCTVVMRILPYWQTRSGKWFPHRPDGDSDLSVTVTAGQRYGMLRWSTAMPEGAVRCQLVDLDGVGQVDGLEYETGLL